MRLFLSVFLILAASLPAWAHHSFAAEYDSNKVVKLTGAVTKVDWQNPHGFFYLDIKDPTTGKVDNWSFQTYALITLKRAGIELIVTKVEEESQVLALMERLDDHDDVQSVAANFSNWRGVIGPKGMTPAQIAFWDDLIGKVVRTDEWTKEVAQYGWEADYMNSAESRKFLERQHEELKAILGELGLAK